MEGEDEQAEATTPLTLEDMPMEIVCAIAGSLSPADAFALSLTRKSYRHILSEWFWRNACKRLWSNMLAFVLANGREAVHSCLGLLATAVDTSQALALLRASADGGTRSWECIAKERKRSYFLFFPLSPPLPLRPTPTGWGFDVMFPLLLSSRKKTSIQR